MHFLVRSGIWKLISADRFKSLRKSILYNPGKGAAHRINIEIKGRDKLGKQKSVSVKIVDPAGQSHLTAVGTAVLIEQIVERKTTAGIFLGESFSSVHQLKKRLLQEGIGLL